MVCATRQQVEPDFYWMNLVSQDRAACAVFLLNSLNPTIGAPGDACVNFVTHLQDRHRPLFQRNDRALWELYREDFRAIFGCDLDPFWTNVARVPMYSPIFRRSYHNPPVRSSTWSNVYFAGNYRTFPSVASTGTALGSGLDAGAAILADRGQVTEIPEAARRFRLCSMPRG